MTHLYCDWSFPPTSGDLNFCSKILIMLMKSIKFTCKENKYTGYFWILCSICSTKKFLSSQTGFKSAWESSTSLQNPSALQGQTFCVLQHQFCHVHQQLHAHQCCSGWKKPLKAPVFRKILLPLLQLRTDFPAGWDTGCGFLQSSTVLNCHMDSQGEAQRQFWPSLAPHLNFQYFLLELQLVRMVAQLVCLLQSGTKRASHKYLPVLAIDADIVNEEIRVYLGLKGSSRDHLVHLNPCSPILMTVL